jgi:hypothetical protein
MFKTNIKDYAIITPDLLNKSQKRESDLFIILSNVCQRFMNQIISEVKAKLDFTILAWAMRNFSSVTILKQC